jgi:enoyl-CoA hydratase/carnithine racemase
MEPYLPAREPDAIVVERPSRHVALVRIAAKPLGVLRVAVKNSLLDALDTLDCDRAVRAVVLTGTGRAFSVGSDVRDFRRDPAWLLGAEHAENALNDRIATARFPVIAAINGHALGGGLVLALACDLRIAARGAMLGVPEVKVGAFASGSGTQRLPRLVGRGRALHMLLTGRIATAEEALRHGLVEEVVEDDRLIAAALSLAEEIAAMPPAAVAACKACVEAGLRHGMAEGMRREADYVVSVGLSDDAAEGQRAFIEKRSPRFSG